MGFKISIGAARICDTSFSFCYVKSHKKSDDDHHSFNELSLQLVTNGLMMYQLDNHLKLLIIPRNTVAYPYHSRIINLEDAIANILYKTTF